MQGDTQSYPKRRDKAGGGIDGGIRETDTAKERNARATISQDHKGFGEPETEVSYHKRWFWVLTMVEGYLVVKIEGLEVSPVVDEIFWVKADADICAKGVCRGKFGQVVKVKIKYLPHSVKEALSKL